MRVNGSVQPRFRLRTDEAGNRTRSLARPASNPAARTRSDMREALPDPPTGPAVRGHDRPSRGGTSAAQDPPPAPPYGRIRDEHHQRRLAAGSHPPRTGLFVDSVRATRLSCGLFHGGERGEEFLQALRLRAQLLRALTLL